ncbi:MAG: hypothetical protein KGY66_07210 [Candidatus Thermoplasmatota archaeon]|nr:hypothetical protein [Candidatus Thermoplasmatota archaeon]MBS3790688.1 hypothetical protein [Candidatus Thermoplasmatota archaeon]
MELNEIDFKVEIRCPMFPTEDKETLIHCNSKVFPKTNWSLSDDEVIGKSNYLTRFKKILEDMRIRDTARQYMKERVVDDECSFTLSKQATCNAKVNFSEEEKPLGELEVKIVCNKIDALIENLTETEE